MIQKYSNGAYLVDGKLVTDIAAVTGFGAEKLADAYKGTMSYSILNRHNDCEIMSKNDDIRIKFDSLTSHDITYVGIVQTARASGLEKFPIPYVLTNCHNSLCAVGGTINEDDHVFGLSAAKKYGGIYVPAHLAVIHQYMREMMAGCGKMILGSDSHTRYGAFGTMAIGEGGPELVKQILKKTYDIKYPDVVAVELRGNVRRGVGPQDVALAIIGATFKDGFVKNSVMEFFGEGVNNLSVDFRCGIDVMTTETTCLSSIWTTDEKTERYFEIVGRSSDYKKLQPEKLAYYDRAIVVDLDKIEPMIAMPFHPSNVYKLGDVIANPYDILSEVEREVKAQLENPKIDYRLTDKIKDGNVLVDQAIIAGCAGGTYENLVEAASIIAGKSTGDREFNFSVYPSSQPIFDRLISGGQISEFMASGAIVKTAFCGPCFGAGDTPANNALSIRHTTRNFPSREGSKPGQNQISSVALMDARSIAATAANGGKLTSAMDIDYDNSIAEYKFNENIYKRRVYFGFDKANAADELKFGPNIADWPEMIELKDNMLMKVVSAIFDEVTTTDELIPSGETSSYRSNPMKLAEFTLSRKDPNYVKNAKQVQALELRRRNGESGYGEFDDIIENYNLNVKDTAFGSTIFAKKPGDGSAREQAASCQRVLGASANIANEYATKRYRSNLINWGMLPFVTESQDFKVGDLVLVCGIRNFVLNKGEDITATVIREGKAHEIKLSLGKLTGDERKIILDGCLINFYRN